MTPPLYYFGRGAMSDEVLDSGDVIDARELWLPQFRHEGGAWTDIATHRADPAEALRIYDFWVGNHADVELRMTKTYVTTVGVSLDVLREAVAQKADEKNETAVQSE
jgi:hypothetical protein